MRKSVFSLYRMSYTVFIIRFFRDCSGVRSILAVRIKSSLSFNSIKPSVRMMSKPRKSDPASLPNTSAPAVSHHRDAVQKQRPHLHRRHRKGLPIRESLAPESGFLQIPPYDGHPCLWLNPPATGRLQDLHPGERASIGRKKIEAAADWQPPQGFTIRFPPRPSRSSFRPR